MALTLIHVFTSNAGVTYTILYESDTNTTTTQISPEGAPESFVTEAELGRAQDELYSWLCDDNNKISFYATTNYPVVYTQTEAGSPSCSYVIPYLCTLDHAAFNVTPETQAGLNDGSITMDVSFGTADPLQYSLDNMNWQPSNIFIGLMPGTYNGYARSPSKGCLYTAQFTIAAGAELLEPDIPWQEKLCYFFKLIIGGVEYLKREPGKWDQVNIIGKRDKDWHGWNYAYSDGKVDLEFDCAAGKEEIDISIPCASCFLSVVAFSV